MAHSDDQKLTTGVRNWSHGAHTTPVDVRLSMGVEVSTNHPCSKPLFIWKPPVLGDTQLTWTNPCKWCRCSWDDHEPGHCKHLRTSCLTVSCSGLASVASSCFKCVNRVPKKSISVWVFAGHDTKAVFNNIYIMMPWADLRQQCAPFCWSIFPCSQGI